NLAESRLFLSMSNYGLAWLWRPGVLVIMALTLAGAFYPFLRTRWQKKKGRDEQEPPTPKGVKSNGKRKFNVGWATAFSFAIVVIFIYALWESRRFDFATGFFPWSIGFPVLGLAIIQFIMDLVGKTGTRREDQLSEMEERIGLTAKQVNRRTAGVFGWIIVYFLSTWLLGFTVGLPLCTFIQLKIGEREKWSLALILTGIAWAFIYSLFERLLHVPFPTGQLFLWLKFSPI
ncbi:MAG: tripartite tricarboxylate transporter TctB family protein, partial [Thermodesulfobacteriota bacterium]|nr:tripartite tricarboxylate transporter TctB family protein [Thermodesulfobacteriota bacterium]